MPGGLLIKSERPDGDDLDVCRGGTVTASKEGG